jgi:hypothetical protein
MTILDRQGRLFGKVSIFDIAAVLIILAAGIGIFVPVGNSSGPAAGGKNQTAEVDMVVRGLNVLNVEQLEKDFAAGNKISFLIRTQPTGSFDIKSVKVLDRLIVVPQPDGSTKAQKDPRPDLYNTDLLMTVTGKGQATDGGFTMGGSKVKIGTSVEIKKITTLMPASSTSGCKAKSNRSRRLPLGCRPYQCDEVLELVKAA